MRLVVLLATLLAVLSATLAPASASTAPILAAAPATASSCGTACAVVPVRVAGALPPLGDVGGGTAADTTARSLATLQHALRWAHTTWWDEVQDYDAQAGTGPLAFPWSGNAELQQRPNANVAFATAVALTMGAWSDTAIGFPRATAVERAARLVCTAAATHRVNGGTSWGGEWQAALWAAHVGYAGWLLWGSLGTGPAGDQCREQVRRVVEHEADRRVGLETPAMYTADGRFLSGAEYSRSEENSWNLQLFCLADAMMPNSPDAPSWRSRAVEYAVSAFATPADVRADVSVVNGLEARRWVSGSNVLADHTIVNHGIVNPDYMVNIAHHNAVLAYRTKGAAAPQALWYGQARNFAALTTLSFVAGRPYGVTPTGGPGTRPSLVDGTVLRRDEARVAYPHGPDWGTRRTPQYWVTLAMAQPSAMRLGGDDGWEAPFSRDAYAMQQRFPDGRTFAEGSGEDRYDNTSASHEALALQQYASVWATKWLAHNRGGLSAADGRSVGLLVDNTEAYSAYPLAVRKKWAQVHPTYRAWRRTANDPRKVGQDALYADPNRSPTPTAIARFHASLPPGTYDVLAFWPRHPNRATNATFRIVDRGTKELARLRVDQRSAGDAWRLLRRVRFGEGRHYVEVNNAGANGYVLADAVRFVKVG